MWDERRSLLLSKICTLLGGAALAGCLIFGPRLARFIILYSANAHAGHFGWFLATFYSGGLFMAPLLVCLYRLLNNLSRGDVFVPQNVSYLRRISWCCFAGMAVCFASFLYYLPWGIVGLAAAFVGLIVRVVKNVIAEAIVMKEENDYTI